MQIAVRRTFPLFTAALAGGHALRRLIREVVIPSLLLVGALGCAAPTRRATFAAQATSRLIAADEIASARSADVYGVIDALRPAMLRARTKHGTGLGGETPVVYRNDTRLGDIDRLREISAGDVLMIVFLGPSEAQMRWGSGHSAGAIQIVTRTTVRPR